jgi:hypothetical protein
MARNTFFPENEIFLAQELGVEKPDYRQISGVKNTRVVASPPHVAYCMARSYL